MVAAARSLAEVYRGGGRLFTMGNGGSSCDARMSRSSFIHPVTAGRPALDGSQSRRRSRDDFRQSAMMSGSSMCLCANSPRRHDAGDGLIGDFDERQLGEPASPPSKKPRRSGSRRIGLAGGDGGRMKSSGLCDHCLVVPSSIDPPRPGMPRRRLTISFGIWCTRCWPTIAARLPKRRSGAMKYVDEFRDPKKRARCSRRSSPGGGYGRAPGSGRCRSWRSAAATRIRSSATASKGCCRGRSSWCTGRAARSACCRWVASTIASRWPRHPGVIFTTFGDAMRVPGSRKSLLQAKADGADIRMVYSPLDALELARKNPDREVVFLASASRRRCRRPPSPCCRRSRGHRQLLAVLQSHHDHPDDQGDPRFSPDLHSTAFLGPAMSRW